jgi:hypothetical protein
MAAGSEIDIRPRTTGEIMDDAWRLYLADIPTLWLLAGIFYVPLAVLVLLLVTARPSENTAMRFLLPMATALAVPWTGIGAGACQEAFRRRPEGGTVASCLGAAFRSGLHHAAARGIIAGLSLVGFGFLILPGVTIWSGSAPVHPFLAAKEGGLFQAFQAAGRESQRQPGKVLALTLGRAALLIFTVLNLHMLVLLGVWVGENLAGFDWAALAAGLSLLHNPTYGLVLILLAWLLLAPYGEAVNYLFHIDSRTRYEGLDLWHRVRRQFRLRPLPVSASPLLVFLLGLAGLAWPAPVQAADALASVRDARREISVIREEVSTKEPFPGGEFWSGRLHQIAERLDPAHRKYRWLHQAIEGLRHRNRDDALLVLDNIDQKLSLIEENLAAQAAPDAGEGEPQPWSKEQIKNLLPQESEDQPEQPVKRDPNRQRRKADQRQMEREDEGPQRAGRHGGAGLVAPAQTSGLSTLGWIFFWGILLAVCAAALVIAWRNWTPKAKSAQAPQVEITEPTLERLLAQANLQTVAELWRQAESLAQQGRFLDAVRSLYLAVLAYLHRSNRIRYEPTRTNGEYMDQLRSYGPLQESFRGLTGIFELKWYGERNCGSEDFASCRQLADAIRKFEGQNPKQEGNHENTKS